MSKKSPFFDKVLLQLWSLQKQTKCHIIDSETCWGSVLMIYVFKFRLLIIIPNTPTPATTLWGVYLFHNDYISAKKWFLHNNSFSFWLKMMILHICICWQWPKENCYWFMGSKGQREKEGDLTQSYDKTPYTNRKFENKRITHKRHQKLKLHNDCGPT